MIRPCAAARSRSAMRRRRGVVAAASYEARAFGVRSAMPSSTALRKCPDLVFVPPRFEIYRAVSRQIHAIFADYTSLIEPLSLDEAYLDVTENLRAIPTASATAAEIRARIFERDRSDRVGRHLLQQVSRQARLRPSQAQRPVRRDAGDGRCVRRGVAGRQVPWRRAGHCRQDEPARHLHRCRSAATVVGLPAAALRQVRSLVSRHRQWRGPPSGRAGPPTQVLGIGNDLRQRPDRIRPTSRLACRRWRMRSGPGARRRRPLAGP